MGLRRNESSNLTPQRCSTWPRRLAQAGVLGILAVNTACVPTGPRQWIRNGFKVGPNHQPPPAPVAEGWIEGRDPRVQAPPPRDGNWWGLFQDPVLSSLVIRAYGQNPNLRSVGTRVLQARAQQAIAVGNVFPQSQNILGAYSQGTFDGGPEHLNATAFNLSWELDFWGKYRRQVESANARLDASVDNYDDALVTLLADVATYYVQYRVAQQRILIARDNLKVQENLAALVDEQQRVGTATVLDAQQLRTLLEQTRATIPALRIALGQANDRLCTLLGEPPRDLEVELGPGPELGQLPMAMIPNTVAAGIPAELLRRRPDVRSVERQVAAQTAQIGVAEADFYPSISIGTTLGQADFDLGPALAANGGLAFVTPQVSWKILNYGRIVNNVRLQDAKTQELIAAYEGKVLTAAQEVQTALRGFLRSQDQANDLTRGAAAATAAATIGEKLFTDLKADVNRLFNLENSRLLVQDQLAVAQGNIAINMINVYRALGGGWELRLQQPNGLNCSTTNVPAMDVVPSVQPSALLPEPKPVVKNP